MSYYGKLSPFISNHIQLQLLNRVKNIKDLGVLMSLELSFNKPYIHVVKRAYFTQGFITLYIICFMIYLWKKITISYKK